MYFPETQTQSLDAAQWLDKLLEGRSSPTGEQTQDPLSWLEAHIGAADTQPLDQQPKIEDSEESSMIKEEDNSCPYDQYIGPCCGFHYLGSDIPSPPEGLSIMHRTPSPPSEFEGYELFMDRDARLSPWKAEIHRGYGLELMEKEWHSAKDIAVRFAHQKIQKLLILDQDAIGRVPICVEGPASPRTIERLKGKRAMELCEQELQRSEVRIEMIRSQLEYQETQSEYIRYKKRGLQTYLEQAQLWDEKEN